jgi:hypothetical protein
MGVTAKKRSIKFYFSSRMHKIQAQPALNILLVNSKAHSIHMLARKFAGRVAPSVIIEIGALTKIVIARISFNVHDVVLCGIALRLHKKITVRHMRYLGGGDGRRRYTTGLIHEIRHLVGHVSGRNGGALRGHVNDRQILAFMAGSVHIVGIVAFGASLKKGGKAAIYRVPPNPSVMKNVSVKHRLLGYKLNLIHKQKSQHSDPMR